jgi:hypothetical protein
MKRLSVLLLAAAGAFACGEAKPGGMSGPTLNNHVGRDDDTPGIQSNDVLGRDPKTTHAKVKHVLVSWDERGEAFNGHQDKRAQGRSRKDADSLAVAVLKRARAGEDFDSLMKEFSEDPGSAENGTTYDVKPDAGLVFEFKRLALRLDVGESGLVLSKYGWHIMKRTE